MIQELNLDPWQSILLILFLIGLLIKLWGCKSYITLDSKPKKDKVVESTTDNLCPYYGAIIQLTGRIYD